MQIITSEALLSFLAHVGTGLGLMILGVTVFAFTTKFSEAALIKEGNIAVALKLWGKAIGLAIVIYTVWANSLNLLDAFIWGLVGIATQVIAYWIIEYVLTPRISLAKSRRRQHRHRLQPLSAAIIVGLVVAGS